MNEAQWIAVDDYLTGRLGKPDPVLAEVLAANAAAGLPRIDVSEAQGKLLHLLARAAGVRRALEIGTLGGYSAIWLARALPPGGRLVTLEADMRHASVARANLARAGLGESVDLRVGPALETLPMLEAEGPFDLVFIDADKPNNPHYLRWAIRLSRPGGMIILDNVVRGGAVLDAASDDPAVIGTRAAIDLIAEEPRLSATAVQTVGAKGWDGFVVALVA